MVLLPRRPTYLNYATVMEKDVKGGRVGKRKVKSEDAFRVTKMLGGDRLLVSCQDGKERLCRIRGKMKRRMWIRLGDIVLVSPWDFQSDKRGDIIWRYKRNQAEWLRRNGYLKT
jgi:translation initiation factor 1A